VKHIRIESNFGDGMFTKLLTPFLVRTYPVTCEDIVSSRQKELRIIDTLEPVMNQHRLIVSESVIREDLENYNKYGEDLQHRYQLFYQMSRVTKDKGSLAKDDRLDVLAMAVAYWVEQMDKDTRKAVDEFKEEAFRKEVKSFMDGVFGFEAVAAPNWMN
jgi:hypothetical protein